MGQELEQHVLLLSEKQQELEILAGKLIEAQEEERNGSRVNYTTTSINDWRLYRSNWRPWNEARSPHLGRWLDNSLRFVPRSGNSPTTCTISRTGCILLCSSTLAWRSLMQDHVAEFMKRTGLSVTFTAREAPAMLSPEIATNLFRVMQESLQNVFKHAQATTRSPSG